MSTEAINEILSEVTHELEQREFPTRKAFEANRALFYKLAPVHGLTPVPESEAWNRAAFLFTQWRAWKLGPNNGREYPRPKIGLCFYGPCGAGKTALADYTRKMISETTGVLIRKVQTADIVERYSRGELRDYELRGMYDADVLVDDLGYERDAKLYGAQWGIADFLKFRYESAYTRFGRFTMATTNLNGVRELEERYGSQISSRCEELFDFALLEGPDRRKEARKIRESEFESFTNSR